MNHAEQPPISGPPPDPAALRAILGQARALADAQAAAVPSDAVTVRQVVERYLAHARGRYEARALQERLRFLNLFVEQFGDLKLAAAKPAHLLDFVAKKKSWKSDWTKRLAAQTVQTPFNWADRLGLIVKNPFAGFTWQEGTPRRPMTEQELRACLRHSDALFRRVLLFLRWTGCRPGEMASSTWADVDWQRCCIILSKHKTHKKTRKPRVIPLTPAALRLLLWLYEHATDRAGRIFLNRAGTPWNHNNLSLRFQTLRYRAGIPKDCHLYGTRHAFGTQGVLNGANLKLLSKAMGHRSVATTEKYYVHIDQEIEYLRVAAAKATQRPAAREAFAAPATPPAAVPAPAKPQAEAAKPNPAPPEQPRRGPGGCGA